MQASMETARKTERVVMLATVEFKAHLTQAAKKQGISVGELVRSRFDKNAGGDEKLLIALTAELREAVKSAKQALREGLSEADKTLAEIRAARESSTKAKSRQPRSSMRAAA